jgi:hypothetical protein
MHVVHELTSDFAGCLPIHHPFMRGIFEPVDAAVDVDVAVSARVRGFATVNLAFVWAAVTPPLSPLRVRGHYHPLLPAAIRAPIGKFGCESPGTVSRRLRIEGLNPASTYTWALEYAVVGGYETIDLGRGAEPSQIALTPDERHALVSDRRGRVWPVALAGRPGWLYRQDPYPPRLGAPIEVGGTPAGLAVTSDNTSVILCDESGDRVVVIDVASNRVRHRVRMPPGASTPSTVACVSPTEVWIGCADAHGHVGRLDLSPRRPRWDELAATGSPIVALGLGDDGDVVYAVGRNGSIGRRPIRSGNQNTLAGNQACAAATIAGGRIWTVPDDSTRVAWLHPATLARSGVIETRREGTVANVAATDDGRLVLTVSTKPARLDYYSTDLVQADGLPQSAWFDGCPLGEIGRDVRLMSDASILVTADTSIHIWPGATLLCEPNGGGLQPDFWDDFAQVRFDGVKR